MESAAPDSLAIETNSGVSDMRRRLGEQIDKIKSAGAIEARSRQTLQFIDTSLNRSLKITQSWGRLDSLHVIDNESGSTLPRRRVYLNFSNSNTGQTRAQVISAVIHSKGKEEISYPIQSLADLKDPDFEMLTEASAYLEGATRIYSNPGLKHD